MSEAGQSEVRILQAGEFFGNPELTVETDSFRTHFRSYSPRSQLAMHAHDAPNIFIMLSGQMKENGRFAFTYGNVGYHPVGFKHEATMGNSRTRILNVEFKRQWVERHSPRALLDGFAYTDCRILKTLVSPQRLKADLPAKSHDLERLISRVVPLLLVFCRQETTEHESFSHVFEAVEREFTGAVSVNSIAQEIGRHPGHLSRKFRQCFGISLQHYIILRRLEHACSLLADSDRPIALIANESGFYDQSHLTAHMYTHIGISPAKYRQSNLTNSG